MPKIFVCKVCGYVFAEELAELIDSGYQVYCERCGSPFNLKGVEFKPLTREVIEEFSKSSDSPHLEHGKIVEKDSRKRQDSSLEKIIQKLATFSYVPVLIVTIISLLFILRVIFLPNQVVQIILEQVILSIPGFIIVSYDVNRINPKIKEGKYQEILLDSFCMGILGCIFFGSGVLILLKGILILFAFILNSEKKQKPYMIGVYIKDSLNRFSGIGGLIIVFYACYGLIIAFSKLPVLNIFVIIGFLVPPILAIIVLIIDATFRESLDKKYKIEISEAVRTFIFGIIGCIFAGAGIFILLKGIIMFILSIVGPPEKPELKQKLKTPEEQTPPRGPKVENIYKKREVSERPSLIEKREEIEEQETEEIVHPRISEPEKREQVRKEIQRIEKEEEQEKQIEKKIPKEEPRKEEELKKEIELRLHESLLPVKNEKDKKLVKEYFTRIFNVLSKDIKQQIKDLKIPKKEKKEILKELAFLTKEQQIKYINNLVVLYQEDIPKKLIERIKTISKIKPEHYENILEQLKYMDADEQLQFIHYLEKNA
ncbi:MAG: hypothetical protein EU550_01995 [Promethearchaeota archaeon]|nr:MAG: hypothetical protein EU550_01995 [Candidatus Lokiarchaeota archaeon]